MKIRKEKYPKNYRKTKKISSESRKKNFEYM